MRPRTAEERRLGGRGVIGARRRSAKAGARWAPSPRWPGVCSTSEQRPGSLHSPVGRFEMSNEARMAIPLFGLAFAGLMAYAVFLQLYIWHVL